jgi:hypothetical protein
MKKNLRLFMRILLLILVLLGAENAYSQRCQAVTKKGTQCKRNAQAGSIYCWQHTRMYGNGSSESATTARKDTIKEPTVQPSKTKSDSEYRQCIAITKKGTRCSRKAQPGSDYCWQHSK